MAKTYTTVVDLGNRSQVTEAIWDAQLRDNLNNLIVPPACRIRHSAAQSITTATETDVSADTEDFDTDSMHDTVTNNPRIIPTTSGIYVVSASGNFDANATGARYGYVNWNNGANNPGGVTMGVATASAAGFLTSSLVREITAGTQYFTYRVFQGSGAGLNWNQVTAGYGMAAVWVGRTS